MPGTLGRTVLDALWDLVWAGEVTNDTPGALRAYLRPAPSSAARRAARGALFRSRRQSPPSAVGRWSRLPRPAAGKGASTARAKALAEQLLARHGVLTRPAVMAEGVAGGFAALYPVLKALEEAGRIRRGYFVAGLGGSQFALPGALDRLRGVREAAGDDEDVTPAAVLAATDPANPYGAALPWPERRLRPRDARGGGARRARRRRPGRGGRARGRGDPARAARRASPRARAPRGGWPRR